MVYRVLFLPVVILFMISCDTDKKEIIKDDPNALFKLMPAKETGILFENKLTSQRDFDVFRYRNYYNGGGVALGDINNDGLTDVYLTSNMEKDRLYINKGNWKFEDITDKAGVGGTKPWSTGVAMADVNGDGFLDIYVCNSGDVKGNNRDNELFINNGDLTFTEKAKEYGLNDKGFSTHAAFFDYDKDGDLDCYILNNSFRPIGTLGYRNLRHKRDELGGHKLMRNDNGVFHDVSEAAGIYGSVIGFGLGVTVGDVNNDGWQDIYVSNDFYERDYLYINHKDGTFTEELEKRMGHISMFSMGADMADINNDGFPEIFSTDMLPEDDYRLKTISAFETYDVYRLRLKNGYYHQFMQNALQLNNQDGTFSEIAQLAGVAASDWSWGSLIADFDNDMNKEILVCNGIFKDVTNQDFIEFMSGSEQIKAAMDGKKIDFNAFVDRMTSTKLSNYLFVKDSELHYSNKSKEWGLGEPSFSNGAAYGDLDNDGDLDLIINNLNMELFVYKNRAQEQKKNSYLSVSFKGDKQNVFGLGAKIKVYVNGQILFLENMPIRGFQSSMDYRMTIGLGVCKTIDSLNVTWLDGKEELLKGVKVNQHIIIDYANAKPTRQKLPDNKFILVQELADTSIRHTENEFNDFDRDRLLYHMLSTQGPATAVADLNHDGRDDIFLGGSVGHPGCLYIQQSNDKFLSCHANLFANDSLSEDVDAVFFDSDGDSDLDLYVVSGGTEHTTQDVQLMDRIYENTGIKNGIPQFVKTEGRLPLFYQSGSCVRPIDVDNDGDLDLFIGTRVLPSYYGMPCSQYLFINDGKGFFSDATQTFAPQFQNLGMVTDAQWFDYDKNGFKDLIIVGDWMPITIFQNDGKRLSKIENIAGLQKSEGWWNRIVSEDLDGDGDADFVLGNLGLNSKFKPTHDEPISLYVNDFDKNGSIEPIFVHPVNGKEYTMSLRQEMVKQMSSLKKKFLFYKDYADKSLKDIFDSTTLNHSTHLYAYQPNTSVLLNQGDKGFELKALPIQAQFSPVYGIATYDINNDKKLDVILGGNLFSVKPEIGKYDAMNGLILLGDGSGKFEALSSVQSGLKVTGQTRHINVLNTKRGRVLGFTRNNESLKFYKIK